MLRAGEVEAAFVRLPLVDADDLQVLPLGRTEVVVALPEKHPLTRRRALGPADLSGLVVSWPRAQAPGYFDDLQAGCGAAPPWLVAWEPDPEHVLAAVAAGTGVSVLDRDRASKLRPRGVTVRRFRITMTAEFGVALEPAPRLAPAGSVRRALSSGPSLVNRLITPASQPELIRVGRPVPWGC